MAKTLDEQIAAEAAREEKHRLRRQQLEKRKRLREARDKADQKKRDRKADTRRKILVGAVILERVQSGELQQAQLTQWLDDALTRTDDRALFDLQPSKA